jgi:hypothetical protein
VRTVAKIYVLIGEIHLRLAVGTYHKVGHISGVMTLGIVEAMLLSVGIKMRAGRLEVGRITLRILMKMNTVLAWREIFDVHLQTYTASFVFPKDDCARAFSLSVDQVDYSFR